MLTNKIYDYSDKKFAMKTEMAEILKKHSKDIEANKKSLKLL